jgi:uncharacterized protein YutE (UPF0331/DUF86 family)
VIDAELINRKLVLISQDLEALAQFAQMPLDDYLGQDVNEAAAERYLERMIGRMIDINFHILVESGKAPPPDYFHSFLRLSDLGIYEHDFAERIAKAAGLRNRIAHGYEEIDARFVYQAIKQAREDVPVYIKSIMNYLDTRRL